MSTTSLSSLPNELKREIVRLTHEIDVLDSLENRSFEPREKTSEILYKVDQPTRKPLLSNVRALLRVDQTFASLCWPILWREVNLDLHTLDQVDYFCRTILPRHQSLVKSIAGYPYTATLSTSDNTSDTHSVDFKSTQEWWFDSLVSSEILKELDSVGIDFDAQVGEIAFSQALATLATTHGQLRALSIKRVVDEYDHRHLHVPRIREETFTPLLSAFRHLTSLEFHHLLLGDTPDSPPSSQLELPIALAGLEGLESLTVRGCGRWFDRRFLVRTPWKAKLRRFAFFDLDCRPQSINEYAHFLGQFKNSLKELELLIEFDTEEDVDFDQLGQLLRLPLLTNLTFGVNGFGNEFMESIWPSPIVNLTMHFVLQDFELEDWGELIVNHKDTLKLLVVGSKSNWAVEGLEPVLDMLKRLEGQGPAKLVIWDEKTGEKYQLEC